VKNELPARLHCVSSVVYIDDETEEKWSDVRWRAAACSSIIVNSIMMTVDILS